MKLRKGDVVKVTCDRNDLTTGDVGCVCSTGCISTGVVHVFFKDKVLLACYERELKLIQRVDNDD